MRKEPKRAGFFSHTAGSAHGPHVMPMLRLMRIMGNLRARLSGGGGRGAGGVSLANEVKVCLGLNRVKQSK